MAAARASGSFALSAPSKKSGSTKLPPEVEARARTEKAEALAKLCEGRFSVLCGRAGTGKTFALGMQAHLGLGNRTRAKTLLQTVLKRDPNHALASDLAGELF